MYQTYAEIEAEKVRELLDREYDRAEYNHMVGHANQHGFFQINRNGFLSRVIWHDERVVTGQAYRVHGYVCSANPEERIYFAFDIDGDRFVCHEGDKAALAFINALVADHILEFEAISA